MSTLLLLCYSAVSIPIALFGDGSGFDLAIGCFVFCFQVRRHKTWCLNPSTQHTHQGAHNKKGYKVSPFAKLSATLLIFTCAAQAQIPNTLSGQWTGATKSPSTGNELQIQVKISEASGTWRYFSPGFANKSPCLNREFPLFIKMLPNAKMIFSVDGPSLITGCPLFALTFERTDEQTLTGTFGDGRPAVLKKN